MDENNKENVLADFPYSDLVESFFTEFSHELQEVFDSRFHFFTQEFSKYIGHQNEVCIDTDNDWIKIDSLSKIRSEVGGRFQNLKDRWVNSGFPLKEKRGEKILAEDINEEAWLEFVNWLTKQDCLVRLAPAGSDYFFAIKHKGNKKEFEEDC